MRMEGDHLPHNSFKCPKIHNFYHQKGLLEVENTQELKIYADLASSVTEKLGFEQHKTPGGRGVGVLICENSSSTKKM